MSVGDNELLLGSNDGNNEMVWRIHREFTADSKLYFAMSCQVVGNSYQREDAVGGNSCFEHDAENFEVNANQIIVRMESMQKLCVHLDKWLEKKSSFQVVLAEHVGQTLVFSLDPCVKDFISSLLKPVAIVEYSAHRMSFNTRFVVDDWTVGQFTSALKRFLNC